MTVQELKSSISSGDIKNVYLFYGEEDYLIRLYISQIKSAIITNPSLEDLNFASFDRFEQSAFEEAVNTPPAFSEKKLIVFDEAGLFKDPVKSDKEFLENAIVEIPEFTTVIFREACVDTRLKKLVGAVEKNGAAVKFDYMTEAQLKQWINVMTSKKGKRISISNMEYLISCVGSSMSAIENETAKLCSFANDEIITREDIDAVVTKSLENRVFQLSDSILAKNTDKALKILHELKILKEEPVKTTALIAKNLCDIYKIKSAKTENRNPQKMGLHPYVIKIHSQSSIKKDKIASLIDSLSKADEKMKSSPLDAWILLEHFVSSACLKL